MVIKSLAQVLESLAEAPLYIGEWLSKRNLRYSLDTDDEAINSNPMDANVYHRRARTYAKVGYHDRAIQDYNEALRLNPQFGDAYAGRALAYSRLGYAVQAREDVDRAVALGVDRTSLEKQVKRRAFNNPNRLDGIAYADRALVRARDGDAAQARQDVERAVELGVDRSILEEEVERRLKGKEERSEFRSDREF